MVDVWALHVDVWLLQLGNRSCLAFAGSVQALLNRLIFSQLSCTIFFGARFRFTLRSEVRYPARYTIRSGGHNEQCRVVS
jgi:hypothetical protein